MGGNYFANDAEPLQCPRMGPEVYKLMKAQILDTLKQHFSTVDCPFEAPEKESFGDIDVVVHGAVDGHTLEDRALYKLLLDVLKPERLHADSQNSKSEGDLMYHAAVSWPEAVPEQPFGPLDPEAKRETLFIQLDIRVCKTTHNLRWNLFKHGHGDIWNMIGSSIRPYGLTVDEEALYIRIPEIEDIDRKRSRVVLTSEPNEILDFLGLDSKEYWNGSFLSYDELFEYVTECRMFAVSPYDTQIDRENLKANDRKRMNQRPAYRRWIDEFIPECRKAGRFMEQRTTRAEVKEEALTRFDAKHDYEERRRDFLLEKQREKIWNNMIKTLAPPAEFEGNWQYKGCSTKALKRIILEGSGEHLEGKMTELKDGEGFFDEVKVQKFLETHGADIGRRAHEAHHVAYAARKVTQAKDE